MCSKHPSAPVTSQETRRRILAFAVSEGMAVAWEDTECSRCSVRFVREHNPPIFEGRIGGIRGRNPKNL